MKLKTVEVTLDKIDNPLILDNQVKTVIVHNTERLPRWARFLRKPLVEQTCYFSKGIQRLYWYLNLPGNIEQLTDKRSVILNVNGETFDNVLDALEEQVTGHGGSKRNDVEETHVHFPSSSFGKENAMWESLISHLIQRWKGRSHITLFVYHYRETTMELAFKK